LTSVPTWPYENAVRASSAAAIVIIIIIKENFKENFVFIVPPEELQRSWKVLSENEAWTQPAQEVIIS
jgi:hypothetical protein